MLPKIKRFLTKRNIVILVLLLLAGGWWWRNRQAAVESAKEVRQATVMRGAIVSILTVSGDVMADRQATLNYSSAGKIAYLGVKPGDMVKKGQVLSYLDLGDLEAAQTKAYYAYLAADANAKKIEDDLKNKENTESFAEKNIRVTAQTTRDSAYDTWMSAQRAVRNARLISPFAGKVVESTINSVGDTASVTDGVTIVDPSSMYFSAEVDEQDVGRVSVGQTANLELDAFEGQTISGKIYEIGFKAAASSTGATVFPVKMSFDDLAIIERLRLGMNGDANIILETRENVMKLPFDAVIDGNVTVIRNGKEETIKVQTGLESSEEIEITGGLNEGDVVVIK